MAQVDDNFTESELREAFQRSGLWRRGWTFQRAIETNAVLTGMVNTVRAIRNTAQQNGKPAPRQQALI
jgi:hypothetical protein